MARGTWIVLVVSWALGPGSGRAEDCDGPRPEVRELLEQAQEAQQAGDPTRALGLLDAAATLDPNEPFARSDRGLFLLRYLGAIGSEQGRAAARKIAREDLGWIVAHAPQHCRAGLARDVLASLDAKSLYAEDLHGECSAEAVEAYHAAERLLQAHRPREAIERYRRAADLCPGNAYFWIHQGDAHFLLNEYEAARDLYVRGLEADPWSRSGHRFLSDVRARLGDAEGAYHECVLAVLSDPTYEAAWSQLRAIVEREGSTWKRVRASKPRTGEKDIGLTLDPFAADLATWIAYAAAKSSTASKRELTVLEKERAAVGVALAIHRCGGEQRPCGEPGQAPAAVADEASGEPSFWGMMDEAEEAGFLDEAIFLHLLDEELLPYYTESRDLLRERLIRYVETVLAPVGWVGP